MTEQLGFVRKGVPGVVGGSDGRLNTTTRASFRAFYASRDDGKTYSFPSNLSAVAGNLVSYLRNTSSTDHLYIDTIKVSADNASSFKVFFGNNVSAAGTDIVPAELNTTKSIAAAVEAKGNAVVTGVTATTFLGNISVPAGGEESEFFAEGVILGQNSNIVIEYDSGATGNVRVDIVFHMEKI